MQKASAQVAMPSDIKRANHRLILAALRSGRTVTAADIHAETGISKPTVMRALQHFRELGVIKSLGPGSTTSMGGKKPELFTFADERRILCINLWPQDTTLALCGLIGDVYGLSRYACERYGELETTLASLGERARRYLGEQGVNANELYGVALSVSGTVDYETKLLRYNSNAPDWGFDVALADGLRGIFGERPALFIDNAGKAAGRSILLDHPEYAGKRLLTLFTTWGVSACMMERGHVLNGRDSLIGEIGHMLIGDGESALCGCGKRGCLQSLVSVAHVRELLCKDGVRELAPGEAISLRALFSASEGGHAAAQRVVRYLAHCFAVALHNLSLTYNQEVVVFQGDFAWADAVFDRSLRAELREFRYYPNGELFLIDYDRRDLSLLAARGCAEPLRKSYFASLD